MTFRDPSAQQREHECEQQRVAAEQEQQRRAAEQEQQRVAAEQEQQRAMERQTLEAQLEQARRQPLSPMVIWILSKPLSGSQVIFGFFVQCSAITICVF